jgi:acyl-ACP thioesterase
MSNPHDFKFHLSRTIASYETDAYGRVSLANILCFFQEAANHHATALNWGLEFLNSVNKFWVLSRLKVKVERYPRHKDEISITTWSRGAEGFFAWRDYQIFLDNQPCISAVSSWLILDKNTHRPVKIEQLGKLIPRNEETCFPFPETKLQSVEKTNAFFEKKVHFSDIDINKHVNNAKYVEIIADAISENIEKEFEIKELDIQYLHESQQNNQLIVYSNQDLINTSNLQLSIENISKGKETCRCEVKLNSHL